MHLPESAAACLCRLLLLLVAVLGLAACASQERLTRRATGCDDVTIVGSDFKRQGVETAWCARCETKTGSKLYQCATNADRTNVQCFEARDDSPCT